MLSLFDVKADVGSAGFKAAEKTATALAAQQVLNWQMLSGQLDSSDFGDFSMPHEGALDGPTEIIRVRVPGSLRKAAPSLLLLIMLQLGAVMQLGAPQWLDSLGKTFGFAVDGLELYLVLRVLWHLNQRD
ncbi:hypothetical protein [Amycolatopsis sp. cmx-11-32]|uniref:hypothetical protein n=1 Tax=Amycolatopsis sp. cmx-11-32 TaxID=2785796 RepID=UPI0039E7017A